MNIKDFGLKYRGKVVENTQEVTAHLVSEIGNNIGPVSRQHTVDLVHIYLLLQNREIIERLDKLMAEKEGD
ncbi:MAG: hypothetical protein IIC79_06160 [Chloroflexi bacterium]|nr:hypothetical protein [Chloroflexota bacterium]